MTPEKVAGQISEAWNHLAKNHGWPTRISPEDTLRKTRVIQKTLAGIEGLSELTPPPTLLETLLWILSKWNWNKTPAPLGLLENRDQWAAIKSIRLRSQEEIKEARKEKLAKIEEWARREFRLRTEKGLSPQQAKKEIEEFAHATGKTQGMTTHEKLQLCETLETLENHG